jgi:hypothetical protein
VAHVTWGHLVVRLDGLARRRIHSIERHSMSLSSEGRSKAITPPSSKLSPIDYRLSLCYSYAQEKTSILRRRQFETAARRRLVLSQISIFPMTTRASIPSVS